MPVVPLVLRTCAVAVPAVLMVPGLAAPAAAEPPVVEQVDRTFVNPFLSEQCGVQVTQHLWGSYSTTYHGDRTITQYRFRSTLTAGDVVMTSRAYGPTIEQTLADGTFVVTSLGVTMRNVPGHGTVGPRAGRTVTEIVMDGDEAIETTTAESGFRQDLAELCSILRG